MVLNSLNLGQGIERLPAHISRQDFFLTSICYRRNKNSLFSPNEDGFKTPAFLVASFLYSLYFLTHYVITWRTMELWSLMHISHNPPLTFEQIWRASLPVFARTRRQTKSEFLCAAVNIPGLTFLFTPKSYCVKASIKRMAFVRENQIIPWQGVCFLPTLFYKNHRSILLWWKTW